MLDDFRTLFQMRWRHRARVYARSAAFLVLCMTAFHFDPTEQSPSGAALWLGFALGVMALIGRPIAPVRETPKQATPGQHARDLAERNLAPSATQTAKLAGEAGLLNDEPAEPRWIRG